VEWGDFNLAVQPTGLETDQLSLSREKIEQDKPCKYNVYLGSVRATVVAVKKQ
jgi:hypothetical protein